MAHKSIAVCDRCKKEKEYRNLHDCYRDDWKQISLKVYSKTYKDYLLCPECCKALGIIDPPSIEEQHSLADRLLEVMVEIAREAMR
jgi:hypothetical protein